MKLPIKNLIIAAAAVSIATLGFSAPKWQEKAFATGDANSDGFLSESEFIAVRITGGKNNAKKQEREFNETATIKKAKGQFPKADSNGDGKLTKDEWFAANTPKKKK